MFLVRWKAFVADLSRDVIIFTIIFTRRNKSPTVITEMKSKSEWRKLIQEMKE